MESLEKNTPFKIYENLVDSEDTMLDPFFENYFHETEEKNEKNTPFKIYENLVDSEDTMLDPFFENYFHETEEKNESFDDFSFQFHKDLFQKMVESSNCSEYDFNENDEESYKNDEIEKNKETIPNKIIKTMLTPCVIIDYVEGIIQKCNSIYKSRTLHNLYGTWQIDRDTVQQANQDYTNRGKGCTNHSWVLNSRRIQVPCNGLTYCNALRNYSTLCQCVYDNIKKPRCICCICYEELGGHIHKRSGRGPKRKDCIQENLHNNNVSEGLEFIVQWLNMIAKIDNELKKKKF
ncbi:hypothetical protein Glove_578g26 [Diversispora epigaea]|uniref:Uncharacterized protein n=1 Tax=Diversispora epigaea TaxID=1348612 RepID=A0A397G998_9GLOM|nr:hypothetical protein Glove_578g26 [Diversispora epigaea]